MDSYLGTIMPWGLSRIPRNWKKCDGSLLEIRYNQALFSLLGNFYGGDGVNNFALPDLAGRVIVGVGSIGTNSNVYKLGQKGGYEKVSLTTDQMPYHYHMLYGNKNTGAVKASAPTNNVLGTPDGGYCMYVNTSPNTHMHTNSIGVSGAGAGHENMQPFTALNYIICVQGIYPPRSQ